MSSSLFSNAQKTLLPLIGVMLQRTLPAGFIARRASTKTDKLPSGSQWLHEIKHDGFRIIARKDGDRVRLFGNDMSRRFPPIADALTGLRSRSCIIDGEAIACDDNGLASFEHIRYRQHDGDVFLYAFDLNWPIASCSVPLIYVSRTEILCISPQWGQFTFSIAFQNALRLCTSVSMPVGAC